MPSKIDLADFMSLSDELLCVFDDHGLVLSMHGEWFLQTGVPGCQDSGFNITQMFKNPERFLQKLNQVGVGEDLKLFAELHSNTGKFREVKIHLKRKSSHVLVATFHDLTEVMNQRHQYEGVASDLNYVLKSVGIGLAELNLQTREVSADETSLLFFGLPPTEKRITEDRLRSVFHTEDLRKVLSESTKFLKQDSRYSSVLRVLDQNTKQVRRYVQIHTYIIRSRSGRAQKLRGAVLDVTHEKTNELALKNQFRFLQSILDEVPFGIFARDPNDHFRYLLWNKYLEKATTAPSNFVIGKTDYDLFPRADADEARKTDLWILEKNSPIEYSEKRTMPDGRKLWAHISKLPIYNEQGLPILVMGLASDISLVRENHLTLARQKESLTQASKMAALGEMAGGIAHEINNPLAIIKGRAEQFVG